MSARITAGSSSVIILFCSLFAPAVVVCAQMHPERQTEAQYIDRAQALIAAGNISEANGTLKAAIRLYPRSGGLYNLIGIVAGEQSKSTEAESAFLDAVKYSASLLPAYLNLARVQNAEGKQAAAIETYERVLRLDGTLEEAHANLGALLLMKGDYAQAERQFEALPKTVEEQNRFRAMECAALAGSGHLDHAKTIVRKIGPAVTEQDVSLSVVALSKLGQNALVIQMGEPLLNNGASKELRGLLATAYAQNERLSEARAIFEGIAHEEPTQEQPLIDAARVAYRQGDLEGSAGYLIRALEIDKVNPELQFFFGIVCIQLNLPGDALMALKEAVRLDPENASFNYALGAAMLSGEKSGNSALYFRKYLQVRPDDPHGRLALGIAEFEAHDPDASRRDLTPLTRDSSVSAGAHYILGKICREQNDLEGAREHFVAALRVDTHDPDLESNLAIVDIRQNKMAEARQELHRALVLDSGSYLANETLLLLLRKQKDPAAEQQAQKFAAITQKVSDEQKMLLRHIDIQHPAN